MKQPPILFRPLHINDITGEIVDAAMKVHSFLGPGLLESAYKACLAHELRSRSLIVRLEVPLPIVFEGVTVARGYKIDALVEEAVIVELKARRTLRLIDQAQTISQLKLSKYHYALMINFHVRRLKHGIHRFVN